MNTTKKAALRVFGLIAVCLSLLVTPPRRRDQRGLSQSTENAILLAGAVAVAAVVIKVITAFVKARLPH